MTTVLERPTRKRLVGPPDLRDVQHLVLEGVSWSLYERLLREVGTGDLRITFDQGRLELVSPLPHHEHRKYVLGKFIDMMVFVLKTPVASYGSSTLLRKDLAQGVEPDQCYYIKNERQMRNRRRFNLKRDPAPELVVEIDITNASIGRQPIYANLGVAELWRYDGKRLTFSELDDGAYKPIESSLAFPFLRPSALSRFLKRLERNGETNTMLAFADWVRDAQP